MEVSINTLQRRKHVSEQNLRTRSGLAARLTKHFAACASAAAAATVITVDSADAGVVHSGVVNITIPSTTEGVYLNVVTGAGSTSGPVAGWDINPYNTTSLIMFSPSTPAGGVYVRGGGPSGNNPANLTAGTLIGAASLYGGGQCLTTGSMPFILNSSDNLVGFRFINEANGNAIHYGWMRLSLAGSMSAQPRTIVEYAWEDQAGVGIQAGAVPAPGALALLGVAGLIGGRRRRR